MHLINTTFILGFLNLIGVYIATCMSVTIDVFWVGNRIYWTL
jgi:hypothetical protein